jgi:uncharacterized protein YodC (DUF2158 family)
MNDVFAPGEVVHLKSGSPLLTVESIKKENGNINTCWYCPSEFKFKYVTHNPAMLVKHKSDTK